MGLLGANILGASSPSISAWFGGGAFVCGEETALIRSIEGKMGSRARGRVPRRAGNRRQAHRDQQRGDVGQHPLHLPLGAEEYAKVGTHGNAGTKIFSLVGKIRNTGLVEVPMGVAIREIVHEIGGGPVGKRKIKAVQTGGPSGGCIPADRFDLPIDYDSLAKAGSIMDRAA